MYVQEHAPMAGNRRGKGSFLCHRSSGGCTCQGDNFARKHERRTMMKIERQQVRNDLRAGLYS